MKRIKKRSAPSELERWFRAQPIGDDGQKINCRYKHMPSDVRAKIKKRLLAEQGYICGYTGIRIDERRSHIEHIKPQSKYYENHEDIDYTNIIAAYPGTESGECPYGAHIKKNHYGDRFISPVSPDCETAFKFSLDGTIKGTSENATHTIEDILKLNHPALNDMRQAAIDTVLIEANLSLKQAETLLEKIYNRDAQKRFRPFCFVLKQACQEYIRRKKKQQIRSKAIASQQNTSSRRSKKEK